MPTAQTGLARPGAAPPPADTAPARGCRSVPLRRQLYPFVAINEAPRLSWRVSSWRARAAVSGRVLSSSRAAVKWLMASAFAECRAACCPARLRYSTAFCGIATATVMMRQARCSGLRGWCGTGLQSPARCARAGPCAALAAPCHRPLPASGHA